MVTKRDSLIFYRSFYEAIDGLQPDIQAKLYSAIFEYSLNFNEVELQGVEKTIFTLIKPQLDANNQRFLNGVNGGRKKSEENQNETKKKPKRNQSKTKTKANNNVNYNDLYFIDNNEFFPLVEKWLSYKKSRKESYKSTDSIKAFYKKLIELSENNFTTAEKIIENSIANNWAGIFKIKSNENGKFESGCGENASGKLGTSAARIEALKNW